MGQKIRVRPHFIYISAAAVADSDSHQAVLEWPPGFEIYLPSQLPPYTSHLCTESLTTTYVFSLLHLYPCGAAISLSPRPLPSCRCVGRTKRTFRDDADIYALHTRLIHLFHHHCTRSLHPFRHSVCWSVFLRALSAILGYQTSNREGQVPFHAKIWTGSGCENDGESGGGRQNVRGVSYQFDFYESLRHHPTTSTPGSEREPDVPFGKGVCAQDVSVRSLVPRLAPAESLASSPADPVRLLFRNYEFKQGMGHRRGLFVYSPCKAAVGLLEPSLPATSVTDPGPFSLSEEFERGAAMTVVGPCEPYIGSVDAAIMFILYIANFFPVLVGMNVKRPRVSS